MAEQLTQRLPLRVMLDCLQVRAGSPDPRRAHAAGLLRQRQLSLLAGGDASVAGVEILLTLADELCAAAPTVLVLDDLQWADDASLLVWHQLAAAASQLPLLLVGTCRPAPGRAPVEQLRTALARRGGPVPRPRAAARNGHRPPGDGAGRGAAGEGPAPADGAGRGQPAVCPRAGRCPRRDQAARAGRRRGPCGRSSCRLAGPGALAG